MAARKENVPLIIAIIVVFSVIVGIRAYRDMHPPPADPALDLAQTYAYFAADDATLSHVPDDQSSIFIKVGDFRIDKDGEMKFISNGPTPVDFPQRDTALFFNIDHLPQDPKPVFDKIAASIEPWKKVGNIFNGLVINDEEDTPDIDAVSQFCSDMKKYFHMQQTILIQIKRHNLPKTPEERNKLANVLKTVQYFIYDFDDARTGQERLEDTLARLDKEELPFMLHLKKLPDDFDTISHEKLKAIKPAHYMGTLLDQVPPSATKAPQ